MAPEQGQPDGTRARPYTAPTLGMPRRSGWYTIAPHDGLAHWCARCDHWCAHGAEVPVCRVCHSEAAAPAGEPNGTYDHPWPMPGGMPVATGWYRAETGLRPVKWCVTCRHWCPHNSRLCLEYCGLHGQ